MSSVGLPQPQDPNAQMPQVGDVSATANPPQPQAPPAGPAPAAAQPSQPWWKTLLQGALAGMAGGANAHNWGQALGGGAAAEMQQKQQQFQNQQQQAQSQRADQAQQADIKFKTMQDAVNASHLAIMGQQLSQMPQEAADAHDAAVQSQVKFLQSIGQTYHFVPGDPRTTSAALQQASANDPEGAHVSSGILATSKGSYVPNTGAENEAEINYQKLKTLGPVYGITPPTRAAFFGSPATQDKQMHTLDFLMQGKSLNGSAIDPKNLQGAINVIQGKLATTTDDTAKTALTTTLNTMLAYQKGALEDPLAAQKFAQQKALAAMRGTAFNDSKIINVTDQNGVERPMRASDALASGALSPGAIKDVNPYIKTAEDSEKSYQMFQSAYQDYKNGASTGAPSMVALSQHLATTFGGVKGSRITKDMISEHLGARSISDDALVAMQKFTNGDVLSPGQWDAFKGLLGNSRTYSWGVATKEAKARGIGIQNWLPKDLGGQGDITTPKNNVGTSAPTAPAAGGDFFSRHGGQAR